MAHPAESRIKPSREPSLSLSIFFLLSLSLVSLLQCAKALNCYFDVITYGSTKVKDSYSPVHVRGFEGIPPGFCYVGHGKSVLYTEPKSDYTVEVAGLPIPPGGGLQEHDTKNDGGHTPMNRDLTVGRPESVLCRFCLPLFGSIIFQQLYNIADSFVAGKFIGDRALAAVGNSYEITLIFIACIIYIIILGRIYMKRKEREARIIQRYNDNYQNILSETHCAVVEYDTDKKTMTTIQENFGDLKLGLLNGTLDAYEEYKHVHPEFDFEELEQEIEIARESGRTCSFETILAPDPSRFYWLKTKLIPITDEDGEMTRIYCVLFDVSDVHRTQETALETYAQIPGAVHRHVLTKPMHVNYYSDGLCKMLGYTHAEIDELIGKEYLYTMLICAEDRQKFIDFLDELAKSGGVGSCEYRLQCKNGELLEVSDTMDAKRSSSGIMYGYSVVTDLHKYREEQQQLEKELSKTRDQLEQTRVKNAGSQMQPHFLYNALSSIREIVLEDPEYASDLIYDFTTHLRACV